MQIRKTIFISHAAPEDNDFTRWLSLQLISLGYTVWSDVIKLKGGEDWWKFIEQEIREKTIKFLLVLSSASNHKDGVLKELAVAQKVKKLLADDQFIVPLHIDKNLSYDDINIELNRLNSINFKLSWATGLSNLIELFEEHQVPKDSQNFQDVKELWNTVVLHSKRVAHRSEIYASNWFPFVELPQKLRFHKFKYAIPKGYNVNRLPYPAVFYKDYLVTFAWCYDFMEELPGTVTYNSSDSEEVLAEDILSGNYDNHFIHNRDAKNIIVRLLNNAFDQSIAGKPVSSYQMSNKNSFWIKKGILEKDKFNKVQLIGKQKEKMWHFGISGNAKMFPERCFVINSHIWFTSDGENLIPEAGKQHAARRKQGKNWWNNDWRNKTHAFMQFLSEEDKTIWLHLGSQELAKISVDPILFESPVTYADPNKENLPDEDYGNESDDDENEIINSETD